WFSHYSSDASHDREGVVFRKRTPVAIQRASRSCACGPGHNVRRTSSHPSGIALARRALWCDDKHFGHYGIAKLGGKSNRFYHAALEPNERGGPSEGRRPFGLHIRRLGTRLLP